MSVVLTSTEIAEMTARPVQPWTRHLTRQQIQLRLEIAHKIQAHVLTQPDTTAWIKALYHTYPPCSFYRLNDTQPTRIFGFARDDVTGEHSAWVAIAAGSRTYIRMTTALTKLIPVLAWSKEDMAQIQQTPDAGYFADPLGYSGFTTHVSEKDTASLNQ